MPHLQGSLLEGLVKLTALLSDTGYIKILATLAGAYAIYTVVYALYLSPLRKIPGPLLARVFGMRADVFGAAGAQACKAAEDYDKYGDVYVHQPNAVSISNPSDIRAILASHSYRKDDVYKVCDFFGTQNTLSARDPKFASMRRRQIGPFFSSTYLGRMESAILQHGILAIKEKWDTLLDASENGQIKVNYHTTFLYATFDIIGRLAFGREFGALRNDDSTVTKWLKATMQINTIKSCVPLLTVFPLSLLLSPLENLHRAFLTHASTCISARKQLLASLEAEGTLDKKPADLLQAFLDATDSESKLSMSPTEVHAETLLTLIAGSETTSNTLMWTMHLLMLYPACYRRAVEEVHSAFSRDHLITFSEAKAQLPYTEACIYESLRHTPVTGGQWPRVVPKGGLVLSSGHFLPGGTVVNINISGANYNRGYWKDPHGFDPTRFLDNEEAKRNVFTFSYGVRVCPGRQLAWTEMLTILANILKDYDLSLPDDYTERGPSVLNKHGHPKLLESVYYGVTMPKNTESDCRLTVKKRQAF